MTKYINLHKNYTSNRGNYQLKLPLNIEYVIPNNDSVRLLSQFVAEMNLTDLYSTYSRRRKNQTTPRQMLKIVLYSYMNHRYSSREMETSCKRDVNFMYLLEGSPVPDHSTFARFRSIHFAPCSEIIMTEEYIVWLTIGDQPTDTTILIPFIKSMENFLYFKYFKIVADAGYEIEENYVYGKENGQLSYINSANYEI